MTEAGQAGRLFVPLASGPFEAFRDGRKTVEVRQARGRWHTGNVTPGRRVLLRRGYSTRDEIAGTVGRVAWASRLKALPGWAVNGAALPFAVVHSDEPSDYFDPASPVLAFEVLR